MSEKKKKGIRLAGLKINRISLTGSPANYKPFLLTKSEEEKMKKTIEVKEEFAPVAEALFAEEPAIKDIGFEKASPLSVAASNLIAKAKPSVEEMTAICKAAGVELPVIEKTVEAAPSPFNADGTYNLEVIKDDKERAKFAEFNKAIDAQNKRIAELEKSNKEAAERLMTEEIAKDIAPFKQGGDKAAMVETLKSVRAKMGVDAYKSVYNLLKTANEAIDPNIFKSIGAPDEGGSDKQNAEKQLKVIAEEIRKSDPKLSMEAAMVQAYKNNPKLYEKACK